MSLSSNTRPDISDVVRGTSRHKKPAVKDWRKVLRIFDNLKTTVDLGITCRGYGRRVCGVCRCRQCKIRRSTFSLGRGNIFCGTVVRLFSRAQENATLSVTQAEYVAIGDGVKDTRCVKAVLKFMQPRRKEFRIPATVREDKHGDIQLANNPRTSHNSKHTDVRSHFLGEGCRSRSFKRSMCSHLRSMLMSSQNVCMWTSLDTKGIL